MTPFQAFLMGSFDEPQAGLEASAHRERLFHDHALAARYGFGTVWESAGWRTAERDPAARDFAWLHDVLGSARRHGLQVAWTLLDRTWPADLDVAEARAFAERFSDFAAAAAREVAREATRDDDRRLHVYQPIRSSALLAAVQAAPTGLSTPEERAWGDRVQRSLADASRAATAAIRASDPQAWIVGEDSPAGGLEASDADALAVVPDPVDATAVADPGAQCRAFSTLIGRLDDSWRRNHKPIVVFGTEASGDARGPTLEMMAQAAAQATASGIVLQGLCVAPLLDERAAAGASARRGLWAVDRDGARIPEPDYARSISRCQRAAMPRRHRATPPPPADRSKPAAAGASRAARPPGPAR